MPTLTIDGRAVTVPPGATLLEAARQAGLFVPTLCHDPALRPEAGCMVCVVEDLDTGRLLPACVAPAREGSRIASDSPVVQASRRSALEMLLSDHPADCEAPCQRSCPSRLDIPAMLRAQAAGDADAALAIVHRTIALPAVLGHICPAPCEKVCRRGVLDAPLAICILKRLAAAFGRPRLSAPAATGRRVTIIGAGPTGLAAACFLRLHGHVCRLLEAKPRAGGRLLDGPGARLPPEALAADLATLATLGIEPQCGFRAGGAKPLASLAAESDALVLACGEAAAAPLAEELGLTARDGRIVIDRQRFQTSRAGIFAAGAATHPCRLAVIANAHGRLLAEHVPPHSRFSAHAGRIEAEALRTMGGADWTRATDVATPDDVRREAQRCLSCDCLRRESCRLRRICEIAHVSAPASHDPAGRRIIRLQTAAGVTVEPAKCISCNICVRLAATMHATLGPALNGRGFEQRITPPLGRSWDEIPADVLRACALHCPTGALATRV
jgi:ferredoxin